MDLTLGFREILDALPDAVIISTSEGRVVHANRRAEDLTGFAATDLVGRPIEDLVPERMRDAHRHRRAHFGDRTPAARPMKTGLDLVMLRSDGREIAVDIALSTLEAEDASFIVSSIRDVTERYETDARLRAAVEVNESLLAGDDSDDILRLVCARARELVNADLATIAAPTESGRALTIRVAVGRYADRVEGMVFPHDQSISGTVIRSGQAEIIDDAAIDDRFHQPVVSVGDIGPAVVVPLSARGNAFATILVANERGGRHFEDRELKLVETFAAQAALTLEYARAQQELRRLMVFEDRERIARDLHDTVIQRLFATGMSLQAAADLMPDEIAPRIHYAIDELDTTIREIRSTIFALETARRRDMGVRADVLGLVRESSRGLGYEPHVTFDGAIDSLLSEEVGEHLLSTLREALSNVARHARATRADVSISTSGGVLHLRVADDGVGMPQESTLRGLGLRNMAERARGLGGSLEISSPARGGTVMDWRVPLGAAG